MCTFGVLGLSCEAPGAQKLPGLHTTTRAHFRVPAFRDTKVRNGGRERGSQSQKEHPNLEPHENLEHTHTTHHDPKTRHEQQIFRRAAPLAKFFWGQGWFAQGFQG